MFVRPVTQGAGIEYRRTHKRGSVEVLSTSGRQENAVSKQRDAGCKGALVNRLAGSTPMGASIQSAPGAELRHIGMTADRREAVRAKRSPVGGSPHVYKDIGGFCLFIARRQSSDRMQ